MDDDELPIEDDELEVEDEYPFGYDIGDFEHDDVAQYVEDWMNTEHLFNVMRDVLSGKPE